MPSACYRPGRLGVISKSGSLSYEVCLRLTSAVIGQSTVLGEIGGVEEFALADYQTRGRAKPVVSFISGASAPAGRKLGHAAATVGGPRETYAAKVEALSTSGVRVAATLSDLLPAVIEAEASCR